MVNKLIILLYLLSRIQEIYQLPILRDLAHCPEYQDFKQFEKEAKWLPPGLPEKADCNKLLQKSSGILLQKIYSYLSGNLPTRGAGENLKKNNLLKTSMSQVSSNSSASNSVDKKTNNNLGVKIVASIVSEEDAKQRLGRVVVFKDLSKPKNQPFLVTYFAANNKTNFYSTSSGTVEPDEDKQKPEAPDSFCKVMIELIDLDLNQKRDDKYWFFAPRSYIRRFCEEKCEKRVFDRVKIYNGQIYRIKKNFHKVRSFQPKKYKGKLFNYCINDNNFVLRFIDGVASCSCK